MSNSILSIVTKDLKIFSRARVSAIFIILAPLLIILVAGLLFNSSSLSGVILGTYSDSYSELTDSLLNDFQSQGFAINKFDSKEDCIDSVKLSKTQICGIFPSDLSETGSANEIVFYVDHSRINLAYELVYDVEGKISAKASNLGAVLAQKVIDSLNSARTSLPLQKAKISDSIQTTNNIISNSKESATDINKTIQYLEDAKDGLNDSYVEQKIDNSITVLKSTRAKLSGSESIENSSEEVKSNLEEVSSNIDSIITSTNSAEVLNADKIVSPIKTSVQAVNSDSNNRSYLIPTIIVLISLFGGILLSSTMTLKEKKTKAYFRNFMTPAWDFTFIVGSYISCMIILLAQFVLVFAGIQFILKINIINLLPNILAVLFVSLSAFVFIGMFIGYIFKSEETTIFAAVLTAAVLMFFSNTILPIETISARFSEFAPFNPLVVSETAFKKIILFGFNLSSVLSELYILGGFLAVFVLLTYLGRKATKRSRM